MNNGWIKTAEWGYYIDGNSDRGYLYQKTDRVQCPHCQTLYPTVIYIVEANYCPQCGKAIKESI